MILLGINCGFGNRDCGTLPRSALDLSGGWVRFPRPKTGIDRRCPLWPETVEAIRAALDVRPEPDNRADAGLVFVTKYGQSWAKHGHEDENTKKMIGTTDDPITKEFGKLLKRPRCPKCGKLETSGAKQCGGCQWKPEGQEKWQTLHRKGLGFYALRHTFETIGGDAKDQVAVDAIMGHSCDDMASVYR
jgi:integrase